MKYVGCLDQSENNNCTIASPTFSFDANNKDEVEFEVSLPSTTRHSLLLFDEATAMLYTDHVHSFEFLPTPKKLPSLVQSPIHPLHIFHNSKLLLPLDMTYTQPPVLQYIITVENNTHLSVPSKSLQDYMAI